MQPIRYLSATLVMASIACAQDVSAAEIYRWTDDDGIVHFSDTKPQQTVDVKSLNLTAANPPGYDPSEDPYSILNQAARINAALSDLEKEREEKRRKRRDRAERYSVPDRFERHLQYRSSYFFSPVHTRFIPRDSFRLQARQFARLEELGLNGPRPHSINSSMHHARVVKSNDIRGEPVYSSRIDAR